MQCVTFSQYTSFTNNLYLQIWGPISTSTPHIFQTSKFELFDCVSPKIWSSQIPSLSISANLNWTKTVQKTPKFILIFTMNLLNTYFWFALLVGALILVVLIWVTFSKSAQIAQPPQITQQVIILLSTGRAKTEWQVRAHWLSVSFGRGMVLSIHRQLIAQPNIGSGTVSWQFGKVLLSQLKQFHRDSHVGLQQAHHHPSRFLCQYKPTQFGSCEQNCVCLQSFCVSHPLLAKARGTTWNRQLASNQCWSSLCGHYIMDFTAVWKPRYLRSTTICCCKHLEQQSRLYKENVNSQKSQSKKRPLTTLQWSSGWTDWKLRHTFHLVSLQEYVRNQAVSSTSAETDTTDPTTLETRWPTAAIMGEVQPLHVWRTEPGPESGYHRVLVSPVVIWLPFLV